MNIRLLNWPWIAAAIVGAGVCADADGTVAAQKALAQTRQELQEQGFKTDLTNFDFSTSPELQAREVILEATVPKRNTAPFLDQPDLMEPSGSNQAVVVWEQESLRPQHPSWPGLTWAALRHAINQREPQIDAACAAILSGPIQFNLDASAGNYMLLPHLALLRDLTQTLTDHAMLALHDGNREEAWTNLMAATRLVTAWNPEPAEISHVVRFDDANLVFNATWQVLQTNAWTDDQLARLQHEWETADVLSSLPEIQAFKRAGNIKQIEQDVLASQKPDAGMYEDERQVLLFYRDREIEFHNAIQAGTWRQMRQMPGVTNETLFVPKYHYRGRFETSLTLRRMPLRLQEHGTSFLGLAAEAEAERRIIVTAVALERYCGKYGRYPETLQILAPEFLKSVPVDFMTGQPLHYRVTEDGHFLLYSAGLDCVDNGGKIQTPPTEKGKIRRLTNPNTAVPESDIVWPLAASSAEVVALRKEQSQSEAERKAQREARAKADEQRERQQAEEMRQAAMKKLLAENPSLGQEPVYQGKPLSAWVIKVGQIEKYNGAPEDAVAAIRAIGPKAVPFLLEWMPHPGAEKPVEGAPGWDDVDIAWWALGSEGKSAIPTLAHLISRPRRTVDDYSVWTESARAISYLGPGAIVPMLTVATNMAGQHELWELLHNFENLGTNGAPAVPALVHWANDPDYWVRDGVVSALGGIGERADLAVPVLMNALQHDSNSMVRRDAATALGSFAKNSEAVLPELIKMVKDPPDWETRAGALSALGKIRNKPEVVVPLIAPFLNDENSVLERYAAYALLDLDSEVGFKALLQATNNPNIGDIVYEAREKAQREKSQ
ncbi:MAG TPA: HEAT repeat domain-containing protein [Verrucomicrobiae bacterium]|nr:HEAT repeat domain-containing protein [Verrucomicrobiae bacterium]